MAQWSERSPLTLAGSILSENVLNVTRTHCSAHVKRVKVNTLPKVVGFLRVLRFPPTGKLLGELGVC